MQENPRCSAPWRAFGRGVRGQSSRLRLRPWPSCRSARICPSALCATRSIYPSPPDAFSDAEVGHALERCGLGNLIPKLDQVERWDKELSLGEQERLAFVRLLLHKPGWVFLDEATAALDEDSQGRVMGLFEDELKNTTVLSIGHRPDLAAYHTRTLQLVHGRDGDRLRLKPDAAPPARRRWLQQFGRWLGVN